ncbi:MAG: trigger factor [Parachlamydiales bacterium]|jgi:trigger factor|nr:trigger factor [Candidatus Acheromyda pituitae]
MEQTAVEPQILSDDDVRVSIHRKPACIVEFDVEASKKLVSEAHKVAVKRIAKEVTLPGFRKGKAPDELVLKNYAPQIDKEWQQAIADMGFRACEKLAKIPLLHRDAKVTYKMKSHSADGALFSLSFETEPTIPSVDPKQMQLKSIKRPEVNDEKVSETIRQVQLFFAEWKVVTGRGAQDGDYVLLDVDVIEETPPTPLFNHTRFEVKEKSMSKWMYDLVLGKNVGDSVEGVSVPDEDASKEDKEELKPKKVRITIKAIDTATLPVLDDAFAQKIGAKTVDELRTNVHNLLEKQANDHVQEALREQASEFLLTQYPFDLPSTLIEKETHFRLKQLMNDKDFVKYWESLKTEDRRKTLTTIHQQSEKAVRMFYLCRKVIADANIRISAQDIPAPATTPLEFLLNPQKMFHHQRNAEIEHAEAFSRLVLEKAEDHIITNATPAA